MICAAAILVLSGLFQFFMGLTGRVTTARLAAMYDKTLYCEWEKRIGLCFTGMGIMTILNQLMIAGTIPAVIPLWGEVAFYILMLAIVLISYRRYVKRVA